MDVVNGRSDVDHLRAFRPFDRLPAVDLRRVTPGVQFVHLRRGKALFYQGDAAARCWLLLAGRVRGIMYRSDETAVELGRSTPGDWLGLAELLLAGPYLNDAIAEESCELAELTRAGFDRLLSCAGMREFFLRDMARRLYVMHGRVELATPFDRMVRYLVERCEETPASGALSLTQEQLAEAIGASRETVNRHLGRLEESGLIKVGRGCIEVTDLPGLRRLCQ